MGSNGHAPIAEIASRFSRVFVTGGAGFIGSHVVKRLVEHRVHVTALILPGDKAPSLADVSPELLDRVTGDLSDVDLLARAMDGADLVIHLAAIYAIWHPRPRVIWDVNVGGTRNVMRAARRAGVPRVVHTSSIAAVGTRDGPEAADEEDGFSDWDGDDYVRSKYVSELEALAAAGDDLEVVVVNPAFPFGPNDTAPTPTGKIIIDMLNGRLPFTTKGGFNAVDVRDVAEGHLLAALSGRSGRRYILGGDNVGHREFANRVAQIAQISAPRLEIPPGVLTRLGGVAEWVADHVTHRNPMMTRRSVAWVAGRWRWYSTERAQRELGYRPRPIDEAIAQAVEWFRGRGVKG